MLLENWAFYYLRKVLFTINCQLPLFFVNTFNVLIKWNDYRIKPRLLFFNFITLSLIDKRLEAGDVDNKARI